MFLRLVLPRLKPYFPETICGNIDKLYSLNGHESYEHNGLVSHGVQSFVGIYGLPFSAMEYDTDIWTKPFYKQWIYT